MTALLLALIQLLASQGIMVARALEHAGAHTEIAVALQQCDFGMPPGLVVCYVRPQATDSPAFVVFVGPTETWCDAEGDALARTLEATGGVSAARTDSAWLELIALTMDIGFIADPSDLGPMSRRMPPDVRAGIAPPVIERLAGGRVRARGHHRVTRWPGGTIGLDLTTLWIEPDGSSSREDVVVWRRATGDARTR